MLYTTITTNIYNPINLLGTFMDYKGMLMSFMRKIDLDCSVSKLDLNLLITGCEICRLDEAHQVLFIMYILEYWNAYAMDIINGNYKHINCTSMIYNSWIKHMAE